MSIAHPQRLPQQVALPSQGDPAQKTRFCPGSSEIGAICLAALGLDLKLLQQAMSQHNN